MADFFSRLANSVKGASEIVRPRLEPFFAPQSGAEGRELGLGDSPIEVAEEQTPFRAAEEQPNPTSSNGEEMTPASPTIQPAPPPPLLPPLKQEEEQIQGSDQPSSPTSIEEQQRTASSGDREVTSIADPAPPPLISPSPSSLEQDVGSGDYRFEEPGSQPPISEIIEEPQTLSDRRSPESPTIVPRTPAPRFIEESNPIPPPQLISSPRTSTAQEFGERDVAIGDASAKGEESIDRSNKVEAAPITPRSAQIVENGPTEPQQPPENKTVEPPLEPPPRLVEPRTSQTAPTASNRALEPSTAPTVKVTIGRIEVHAAKPEPPPPKRAPRKRRGPAVSLDDYLKRRNNA